MVTKGVNTMEKLPPRGAFRRCGYVTKTWREMTERWAKQMEDPDMPTVLVNDMMRFLADYYGFAFPVWHFGNGGDRHCHPWVISQ